MIKRSVSGEEREVTNYITWHIHRLYHLPHRNGDLSAIADVRLGNYLSTLRRDSPSQRVQDTQAGSLLSSRKHRRKLAQPPMSAPGCELYDPGTHRGGRSQWGPDGRTVCLQILTGQRVIAGRREQQREPGVQYFRYPLHTFGKVGDGMKGLRARMTRQMLGSAGRSQVFGCWSKDYRRALAEGSLQS